MKNILFLIILITVTALSASAQTVWKADRAHSAVKFAVTHMMISEVNGRFTDFDVTLTQGKDDFSGSTIEATIKTSSITTDNEFRDKHLKTDDFFNIEKFPAIKFKSTAFEKTGTDSYKITGDLTIREVTKQVILDAKYNGKTTDQRGNTKAGFKATTSIDRFDYGVKWDKVLDQGGLVVSKAVDITLLLEMNKQVPENTEHR